MSHLADLRTLTTAERAALSPDDRIITTDGRTHRLGTIVAYSDPASGEVTEINAFSLTADTWLNLLTGRPKGDPRDAQDLEDVARYYDAKGLAVDLPAARRLAEHRRRQDPGAYAGTVDVVHELTKTRHEHLVPAPGHRWAPHKNDTDDWCPHSYAPAEPPQDDDQHCPAGCQASSIEPSTPAPKPPTAADNAGHEPTMPKRVTFLDYGESLDAVDRPALQPDAVTLGHAYKTPGHGWHVRVGDREHTNRGLTKKQAKALLREWAEQVLNPTPEAADIASP